MTEWNEKYRIWGEDLIDVKTKLQMDEVARLPIYREGALFADAHLGYGLPIGAAVLAEHPIPYGVGVDIGCSMRLTVFEEEVDLDSFDESRPGFIDAIMQNSYFGPGCINDKDYTHVVMDDPIWELPLYTENNFRLKATARKQLGTSGGGNHFVEFGIYDDNYKHLALVSHSGSRGAGYQTCGYYTRLAKEERGQEYGHLAWLEGGLADEYMQAHDLMQKYAEANHQLIHGSIKEYLGLTTKFGVHTPHNQAVRTNEGNILHRKGTTAVNGWVESYVPGTMTAPGFTVQEKEGSEGNLASCSHGAGRVLSRRQAKKQYAGDMPDTIPVVYEDKPTFVDVLKAGKDELPHAYKDIREVLQAQEDIVEITGDFQPLIVRMV